MSAQYAATTRSGTRCTHAVKGPSGLCHLHDPQRADERKRNASRAGKSTGNREIKDLKRRISELIDAVLSGSQDRGRAAVAIQGLNSLRAVMELERRIKETDELEQKLQDIEGRLNAEQ